MSDAGGDPSSVSPAEHSQNGSAKQPGNETTAGGGAGETPSVVKRHACSECRLAKVRCSEGDTGQYSGATCKRCHSLGKECIYQRGRRGRKRKSEADHAQMKQLHQRQPSYPVEDRRSIYPVSSSRQPSYPIEAGGRPGSSHHSHFTMQDFQRQSQQNRQPMNHPQRGQQYAQPQPHIPEPDWRTPQLPLPVPTPNFTIPSLLDPRFPSTSNSSSGPGVGNSIASSSRLPPPPDSLAGSASQPTPGHSTSAVDVTTLLDPAEPTLPGLGSGLGGLAGHNQDDGEGDGHEDGVGGVGGGSGIGAMRMGTRRKIEDYRYLWLGGEGGEGEVDRSVDPVNMGHLSLVEADHLISLFHDKLNVSISLLDPKLHTTPYLRHTSPLLFSCMLCCSAKFFRPELYESIHSYSQMALNRVIMTGTAEVSLIQCLMVLIYWKKPTDNSTWVKLNVAKAMAAQMKLERMVEGVLDCPADEWEARKYANAGRTWLCLKSFDYSYSPRFGLPMVIRHIDGGEVEAWSRRIKHLQCHSDIHRACSLEFSILSETVSLIRKSGSKSTSSLAALEDLEHRLERLTMRWRDSFSDSASYSAQLLHYQVVTAAFELRRVRYEKTGATELRGQCLMLAGEVVELMTAIHESGSLLYLQDVISVTLSDLGLFLNEIYTYLDHIEKRTVSSLLRKVYAMCCSPGELKKDSPLPFVARFFGRLLRSLDNMSRAQTRASSPYPPQAAVAMVDSAAQMDDASAALLQNLLQENEAMFGLEMDEEYWSSILAQTPLTFNYDLDARNIWPALPLAGRTDGA